MTTTSTTVDPEAVALQDLGSIATQDQSQLTPILDQWVPQLSSKQVGLSDPHDLWWPNQPYTNQLILQGYQRWQSRFSNALIFNSSQYISHRPGFWVIVVGQTFPDPNSVIQWCQSQNLSDNDCDAARVSHDIPEGSGTFQSW